MSDKKFKKIGAIPAMLIRFALTIIKNNLISKIPNDNDNKIAVILHDKTELTLEALSDKNFDNKDQLKEIWSSLLHEEEFRTVVKYYLLDTVDNIKDSEYIKEALRNLIHPLFDTILSFSDNISSNGPQISVIWITWLKNKENVNSLLSIILEFTDEENIKDNLENISNLISSVMGIVNL